MTKKIVDQEDRDKIKQQLTKNFLVEAGAGSGKTTCLVERMVNIITTGTGKMNEIVAITFTRKAADELKMRFQSELEKEWRFEADPAKKIRLEEAMKNIDHCFLGTVHSFCSRLLRERPIEAGLDLSFKELEEAEDLILLEEAWELYVSSVQIHYPAKFQKLIEIGIPIEQLFSLLREMKDYTDVEWVTQYVDKPSLIEVYDQLIVLMKEARRAMPAEKPDKGFDTLQEVIVHVLRKDRHLDRENDVKIIEIFELCNKKMGVTLNRWTSKDDARYYEEKIGTFFTVSIAPVLQQWKEYCHPFIIQILKDALNQYGNVKRRRSFVNFQDLLMLTTRLLQNNSEVRQYFQEKYRFLLIDEFQDTDPIQAEMMFYLTSEDSNEKDWTKCSPKPGSLFVVGDPKQAIYRFRRADIDTYNRVKQLIAEHGGEVLQLTMNFRTIDGITHALNDIFKEELPDIETKYQAAYRPLNSYFPSKGEEIEGIKVLMVPSDYTKKEEILLRDSENIAQSINALLQRGHEPKEFMILTRYTEGISLYAKALEDLKIPVNISGEVIIGETKEFQELCLLLKSLTDPSDQLTLVAVLRGVFFGLSDQELYEWKHFGGVFSIYTVEPLPGLYEVTQQKFSYAFKKLRKYSKWVRTCSPTVAIEKMIADVGLFPILLSKGHSKRLYKSVLQIIETLRKQESAGQTTFLEIYTMFSEMVHEKTDVVNFDSLENAVSIMNVHKAKGLEAEIVFLAHPIKKVDPSAYISKHIKREDFCSKGYFAFSFQKGFKSVDVGLPVEWEYFKEEEYQYLREEESRILYVAATRAEKALIISSSAKSNSKNPWKRLLRADEIIELCLLEEKVVVVNKQATPISNEGYHMEQELTRSWLQTSMGKSFNRWSPTEDKNFAVVLDLEREEGGGRQWGSFIHDVLEKLVWNVEVDAYIPQALKKYDISPLRTDEITEYIEIMRASPFWKELQVADEVYTEVPFHLLLDYHHPLWSYISKEQNEVPVIVKGIIDLVYRLNDKWTIVDYKTDRLHDWQEEEKLQQFYRNQISFYQEVWQQMTNGQAVHAELLFLEKEKQRRKM